MTSIANLILRPTTESHPKPEPQPLKQQATSAYRQVFAKDSKG